LKRWTKKVWMSAAAVLIAIMSVSAIPASADVSRVVYFTIQNDTYCNYGVGYTTLFLNVNNVGNSNAQLTVHLYDNNGLPVSDVGETTASNGYYASSITPGLSFALNAGATKHYRINYEQTSTAPSCNNRPAYGKIVIESGGFLMANGEIKGTNNSVNPPRILSNVPITVNGGNPF